MEAEELAIVLNRASDLHLKISEAIERAMKSQRRSAGSDSPSTVLDTVSSENSASGSPRASDFDFEGAPLSDSKPWQGPSKEARSLVAIREALETLEVQLEDLQKLQAVQMQERENALAELEESRRMLLRRLREHQGKEWEVVNEALAFAGEPVEDLAEDDEYLDDEDEYDDEDEDEFPGSPEIGENTGGGDVDTPVTPPTNYSDALDERAEDPVFNLEASLDRVADVREEEEEPVEEDSDSGNEGGGVWRFGKAILKVAGGALAVAATVAAVGIAKEKGGSAGVKPGVKPGVKAAIKPAFKSPVKPAGAPQPRVQPGPLPPTATLSNRALQREKSGLGSERDGMPLCTVRERKVSPVKKKQSADVLLARG